MSLVQFPGNRGSGGGSDGTDIYQRVERLEAILMRLEPKIIEIAAHGAKQADVAKVQQELAEIKGKLTGMDGRMSGLDARFASLPNTWTLLAIVFTTWALGSGILIFAMNFLKK